MYDYFQIIGSGVVFVMMSVAIGHLLTATRMLRDRVDRLLVRVNNLCNASIHTQSANEHEFRQQVSRLEHQTQLLDGLSDMLTKIDSRLYALEQKAKSVEVGPERFK